MPLMMTLLCIAASVADLYAFKVNDWDFSYFSVLPWSIGNGSGWHVPFHEALHNNIPFYAHHWQPFALVLVPFLTWLDSPYTLAVLHALAIGSWFFLLPCFVREIYREQGRNAYLGTALFWELVLFVYRPFWGPWSYQTHLTTLVSPAIFLAILCLHRQRFVWAGIWCVLLAFGQERSSVAVFSIGMYAMLLLRQYRMGGGLCLAGGLYFAGLVKVLFPMLRAGATYAFSGSIQPFVAIPQKIFFLVKFVAGTFFLPLAGKRAVLTACCSFPVLAMGLVSNRESMYGFHHHYQDISAPFLLMAGVYGLLWLQERCAPLQRVRAATVAICVCLLAGSFWQCRFAHPLVHLGLVLADPKREDYARLHDELDALLRQSEGKKLFAQSGIGPLVSLRKERYTLCSPIEKTDYTDSYAAISPLCGTYCAPDYDALRHALDSNEKLMLVHESPVLRVYRDKDTD